MGQKKITELTLRDEVSSDLNFPSDDGIQSYRVTAAQLLAFILPNNAITTAKILDEAVTLAKLKLDILNGLTSVSAADDDYFPLIDTSDSNKTKKALVSTFARNLYRSVVNPSSTSITTSDGTVKISGTAGSVILPTAVGADGKRYKLIHAGTNLTAYTINTTSSQTIGGVASGSYKLITNGEVLEVESDGANWIILNHRAETDWIDAGALVVSSVGGACAFPTVTEINKLYWKRKGNMGYFKAIEKHTSATGATGCTGALLISVSAIGTMAPLYSTTNTTSSNSGYQAAANIGFAAAAVNGSTNVEGHVVAYDTTKVAAYIGGSGNQGSVVCNINNANSGLGWEWSVPMVDWQP